MSLNFVILDGQLYVKTEEQHIAVHLITWVLKLLEVMDMMTVSIYGALEF